MDIVRPFYHACKSAEEIEGRGRRAKDLSFGDILDVSRSDDANNNGYYYHQPAADEMK